LQTGEFEQEGQDHVLNLTTDFVRSHVIRPFNEDLQMDSSHDEENAGGGAILEVDDGTEDLDAHQPQDHWIEWLMVSLIVVRGFQLCD